MASSDLKFVEPADVKELITGENKDRVLVVDVRDDVRGDELQLTILQRNRTGICRWPYQGRHQPA